MLGNVEHAVQMKVDIIIVVPYLGRIQKSTNSVIPSIDSLTTLCIMW